MVTWELRSRRRLPEHAATVALDQGDWVVRWTGCAVMGVVNVTPDSFSDGGLYETTERAVAHGLELADEGALVVDVGGESTRPGSHEVPGSIEIKRVVPVIEQLAATGKALISVDTRKPTVAAAAIDAGANIVNDVGGFRDPAMIDVCAAAGVPVVAMHMQGTPIDMQIDPRYEDVVREVTAWLERQAELVLDAGVPSVMIDPGIGFGKTLEHNLALLRALPLTTAYPVMVGASRKSTIKQLGALHHDENRDAGSIAVHLFAAQRGVAMVRVHDVRAHRQALTVDRNLRGS
jgi:dihydropteroate synthase